MRIGLQNTEWSYIGAVLAGARDDEQAEFFKSFVKECQSWGTSFQVQSQLCKVNNKLTTEEKEVLSMLGYQGE